jgi:hypothetical protein
MASCILIRSPLWAADIGRFLPLLYLAAALILGAVVIYLISRWRRTNPRLSPSDSEQLAQYQLLRKQGAISEEEYRKLRSVLGGEIRRSAGLPSRDEGIAPLPPDPSPPPPSKEPPPESGIKPA